MRVVSQPSSVAVDDRTLKCPCEEHQIVVWPSWPVSATQAWGSMYPLVDRLGGELTLDHQVGLSEPGVDVGRRPRTG